MTTDRILSKEEAHDLANVLRGISYDASPIYSSGEWYVVIGYPHRIILRTRRHYDETISRLYYAMERYIEEG